MKMDPFKRSTDQALKLTIWEHLSPDVVAGFTTRQGGNSIDSYGSFNLGLHVSDHADTVASNRVLLSEILGFSTSSWVCSEQTHENRIVKVSAKDLGAGVFEYGESIKGTDGLYTNEKNVLLTLCFADCVPLYFHSPVKNLVGVAHAGWKGTVKDIAGEMVRTWQQHEGVNPNEIFAAIGPAICKSCYIVDDNVINYVDNLVDERQKPYCKIQDNQYQLDLKSLNLHLLKRAGIKEENINVSSYCTSCERDLFFSHRRDKGKTGRMMSFIGIKEV